MKTLPSRDRWSGGGPGSVFPVSASIAGPSASRTFPNFPASLDFLTRGIRLNGAILHTDSQSAGIGNQRLQALQSKVPPWPRREAPYSAAGFSGLTPGYVRIISRASAISLVLVTLV